MPSPIRNEVALLEQQGYSPEEARRIAYGDMNERYSKPEDTRPLPPKDNGKGFGVIEGIKSLLGIERDPKELKSKEDDQASVQEVEARIGSNIASLMLASPGADRMYQQALSAKNPGAMFGMMAARVTASAREKMKAKGALTDETIWAAQDGVLDNALGEVFSYAKMYGGVEPDDAMIEQAYKAALVTLANAGRAEQDATMAKPKGAMGAASQGRMA